MILNTVYDSVAYDQVKTRSSESQVQELGKSQSVGMCIVNGLSFPFCFRLRQSGFHLIVSYGVMSGIGRKWKLSDSSDSDTVSLSTPLMILTPTSSLVKTAFNRTLVDTDGRSDILCGSHHHKSRLITFTQEDDLLTGCRNISYCYQQCYPGVQSLG